MTDEKTRASPPEKKLLSGFNTEHKVAIKIGY